MFLHLMSTDTGSEQGQSNPSRTTDKNSYLENHSAFVEILWKRKFPTEFCVNLPQIQGFK